jgi:hypothetical protein
MTFFRGAASLLLVGCTAELPAKAESPSPLSAFLEDAGLPLPQRFSELGLRGVPPEPSTSTIPYTPAHELWSDGGEKQRAVSLPEGSVIDARDPEAYEFPLGTLLSKTFSFRTPSSPERAVPVETRLLRATVAGWEYAVYGWDEAGEDAELLDLRRSERRAVLGPEGEVFEHAIPSRLECRQCHESSQSMVLGVNELQLAASGSIEALAERLTPPPLVPYAALPERGPLTAAVLGYFVGNCVHCHNGSNGAASSFDLRPGAALENIVNRPTESSATADGLRVVPGDPEQSVLFQGLRGGARDVKDMPPIGVAVRDTRGIALVRDFIEALGATEDP